MKHTKIGNGYGGFEHAPNETACGKLVSEVRKSGEKMLQHSTDYRATTCPDCQAIVAEQFGLDEDDFTAFQKWARVYGVRDAQYVEVK